MKFRIYQLFFVVTIALLGLAMAKPLMMFMNADGTVDVMDNFALTAADGSVSRAVVALGVVLIFTALVNLFALFVSLFSNFELQKRSTILSMLLLTGYYILLLVYSLVYSGDATLDAEMPMLYPFFGLTINIFALLLIRKQEARIVARAMGFRLRD
jgi:hypothetical protein